MTDAELADAAAANMATHVSWAPRRVAGMTVRDDADLLVVDSGLPCDTFNCVCRARLDPPTLGRRVAEVITQFRAARRPFSWWVGPADRPADLGNRLRAAGLEGAESEVAMAADLADLSDSPPAPADLRIERVTRPGQVRDFAAVTAANWTPPDADVLRFYAAAAAALLAADSPIWLYVGYLGGESVATAELTVAGGVVGLYGVATLAAHRRRGIGGALTHRPLADARAAGHRTAVLQASAAGAGVYARLGFAPVGRYTEYKPAANVSPGGCRAGSPRRNESASPRLSTGG
jgi:GNAT superfamily N-acetyltransferase